jgi:predicted component of type VI protein secretion system
MLDADEQRMFLELQQQTKMTKRDLVIAALLHYAPAGTIGERLAALMRLDTLVEEFHRYKRGAPW